MRATELIKEVAALPPNERTLFEELFQGLEKGRQVPITIPGSNLKWPDFGERLRRIYGDKVAPDSQSIIDDGRGER